MLVLILKSPCLCFLNLCPILNHIPQATLCSHNLITIFSSLFRSYILGITFCIWLHDFENRFLYGSLGNFLFGKVGSKTRKSFKSSIVLKRCQWWLSWPHCIVCFVCKFFTLSLNNNPSNDLHSERDHRRFFSWKLYLHWYCKVFPQFNSRQSLHTSQVAHQARVYPGFCSMKRLRVFLLPLNGMLVGIAGLPPVLNLPVQSYLYIWVERDTVRVKCLIQEHNTMSPARARTRTVRSGDKSANHEATAPHTAPVNLRKRFWRRMQYYSSSSR